jgi:hypothetical protein
MGGEISEDEIVDARDAMVRRGMVSFMVGRILV